MVRSIKIGEDEYAVEALSDAAKSKLHALQFTTERLRELQDMLALLQKAKNSYVESIKMEMIADKAGFTLGDE